MGLSELAVSLEEPFSILPLIPISNKIGANCRELVSWDPRVDDEVGVIVNGNVNSAKDVYDASSRLLDNPPETQRLPGETAVIEPQRLSSFESFVLQQKSIESESTQQQPPFR